MRQRACVRCLHGEHPGQRVHALQLGYPGRSDRRIPVLQFSSVTAVAAEIAAESSIATATKSTSDAAPSEPGTTGASEPARALAADSTAAKPS